MTNSITSLADFRVKNGMTYDQLGEFLGFDRRAKSRAWELCNGSRPSLALAAQIERVTDGAVPMQSWVAPCAPAGDPPQDAPAGEGEAA